MSLILVDGQRMLLESLGDALRRRGHIVLATATGRTPTVKIARELRPDVCLLSRALPDGDGLEVVREFSSLGLRTRVLLLSESGKAEDRAAARAAGAHGCLAKSSSLDDVSVALASVARGVGVWPDLRSKQPRPLPASRVLADLTPRERQVLELLGSGLRTVDIAAGLGISVNTARTHVQRLLGKLGVSNRFQAAHLLHAADEPAVGSRIA